MRVRIYVVTLVISATIAYFWIYHAERPQVIAASPEPTAKPKLVEVRNEQCLACHQNLANDSLTRRHHKNKVSCATCHGPSLAHMLDAQMGVKPDVLLGRAEVDQFCKQCHTGQIHKNPKELDEFVEEWKNKRRPNRRTITPQSICTDCHGEHVLPRANATQPASQAGE